MNGLALEWPIWNVTRNAMGLFRKLFGGGDKPKRAQQGEPAFVPTDDSNQQILGCVLSYIHLANFSEMQKGRPFPENNAVGPRLKSELEIIRQFFERRRFTFRDGENAFWAPGFVRAYERLPMAEKRPFLDSLPDQTFRDYIEEGTKCRPQIKADGIVFFLATIAFQMLGVNPAQFLRS